MVTEKRNLEEEILDTTDEIIEDVGDAQFGTAAKRVLATPVRMARNVFDLFDF